MVSDVTPKAAEKAGVKSGDVIPKFDGQDINEMRELPLMVAEAEVGKKSTLTLWRKGKRGNRSPSISASLRQPSNPACPPPKKNAAKKAAMVM